jgi:hypothetical protein
LANRVTGHGGIAPCVLKLVTLWKRVVSPGPHPTLRRSSWKMGKLHDIYFTVEKLILNLTDSQGSFFVIFLCVKAVGDYNLSPHISTSLTFNIMELKKSLFA